MATYGGWTGKTLRVNLTTGKISQEDTIAKYKDYIGGAGLGIKVMWDEVPSNVKATDPENKIVFAGGPLSGTSAPTSARATITSRSPMFWDKDDPNRHYVITSHMGGDWAPALKYAGWDGIIVEGKANSPCYIAIVNGQVEIRDAKRMWGQGSHRGAAMMMGELGNDSSAVVIGQGGENLVACSTILNNRTNHGGGHGAVMGSKNLKGICVKGTGSVNIAAGKSKWHDLMNYVLPMLSSHNNAQPERKQSWSEYPGFRYWSGGPGSYWGAADPRVYIGETDPHDLNTIGFRYNQYTSLYKDIWRFVVRQDSCTSCPVACFTISRGEGAAKYGYPGIKSYTCAGGVMGFQWLPGASGLEDGAKYVANHVGLFAMDDFGLWENYLSLAAVHNYAIANGILEEKLSSTEYNSIPWDKYRANDPDYIVDIMRRMAFQEGELGAALAAGPAGYALKMGFYDDLNTKETCHMYPHGATQHHYDKGQIGSLMHLAFNRDPATQDASRYGSSSGLPHDQTAAIGKDFFGGDWVDPVGTCSPMNPTKAKVAAFGVEEKLLKDSLTLCGRLFPIHFSPLKERGYKGDPTLESQMYSAVTGDDKSYDELLLAGNRIATLLRAINTMDLNTVNQRSTHDIIPEYMFADFNGVQAFTKEGRTYLDRADWEVAKDQFYDQMGWDKATGAPTRTRLEQLGMKDVADKLQAKQLLPSS